MTIDEPIIILEEVVWIINILVVRIVIVGVVILRVVIVTVVIVTVMTITVMTITVVKVEIVKVVTIIRIVFRFKLVLMVIFEAVAEDIMFNHIEYLFVMTMKFNVMMRVVRWVHCSDS